MAFEKVAFTDGKPVLSLPGKDTVSVIDIRDRAKPRIVVNLSLENSVFGPPTNPRSLRLRNPGQLRRTERYR